MSYWRIMKMGDDVFPFAVGTVDIRTGTEYPPTDGYPYLTDEQLPGALEKARKPRQPFPWERSNAARP